MIHHLVPPPPPLPPSLWSLEILTSPSHPPPLSPRRSSRLEKRTTASTLRSAPTFFVFTHTYIPLFSAKFFHSLDFCFHSSTHMHPRIHTHTSTLLTTDIPPHRTSRPQSTRQMVVTLSTWTLRRHWETLYPVSTTVYSSTQSRWRSIWSRPIRLPLSI